MSADKIKKIIEKAQNTMRKTLLNLLAVAAGILAGTLEGYHIHSHENLKTNPGRRVS